MRIKKSLLKFLREMGCSPCSPCSLSEIPVFMRVSEFFRGLFTGLFSLVHRVVQPCSVSEIQVFMRVSEFLRGLFTGLFA